MNIINGDEVLINFAVHGPWCTVNYLSGQKKKFLCEISGFRRDVVVVALFGFVARLRLVSCS